MAATAAGEQQGHSTQATLAAHGQEPSFTWLPGPMQRLLTNSVTAVSYVFVPGEYRCPTTQSLWKVSVITHSPHLAIIDCPRRSLCLAP